MDRLLSSLKRFYTHAFSSADKAFNSGRVASNAKSRKTQWRCWVAFVTPLEMDPLLQDTQYKHQIRALKGFVAVVREEKFNKGNKVRASTGSSALTSVEKACAMAHGINPTKCPATSKFHTQIQETLDGWRKEDPATKKMLPVEADVPEFLMALAVVSGAKEKDKAEAELATIAFYYLLQLREYTAKGKEQQDSDLEEIQTQPFRLKDVTFFGRDGKTKKLYRNPVMQAIGTL